MQDYNNFRKVYANKKNLFMNSKLGEKFELKRQITHMAQRLAIGLCAFIPNSTDITLIMSALDRSCMLAYLRK